MSDLENLIKRLHNAGNMGCDFSPGDELSKEAAIKIEKLVSALKSIPCPSCQGFGKSPDPYDPEGTPCGGCKGAGIHPIALKVLGF